jgi:dTMP kinase
MGEPRFIVFEGIDGSGITTQVEFLRTWCEERGIHVLVTKEPTDGLTGGLIRAALTHRVAFSPEVMALLFAADRLDHLHNEVLPDLESGATVICDRYYLSEFAYQSVELELSWLRDVNSKCRRPDLTVFLDVPVELCLRRWHADVWRSSDRFQLYETEHTLRQVRERYLETIEQLRAEGERIEVVDGSRSIKQVHASIVSIAGPLLASRQSRRSKKNSAPKASREIASILRVRSASRG